MRIHYLDLAIILLYVVGITLFGMRFRRGQQDIRDYFLGGRTAPWWAIAFSIVATETSLLTVIGTPALAFAGNLGFLQLVLGYNLGRILICLVFIPQYFRGEFFTAYQLIERRFGAQMKSIAAGTFLLTRTLAEGVRVAAITKVVSVAFGIEARTAVILIAALTLIYTFEGGMKAVIWTDVIQLGIYVSGAVLAAVMLLKQIPGGWAEVTQVAAAAGGKLRIFDFTLSLTQTYTFWSGVLGGAFLTLASHGTDQLMVQRLLAARNERDSKKALLASGVIVFAQFALFLLLGVMLYTYHQHSPLIVAGGDKDRIFPEYVVREMPVGITGLVIAAIFAAAMSNLSGALNSLASSSIVDFMRKATTPEDTARTLARSRWITVGWGLVLMVLGTIKWGPVLETGLTVASIIYQSLLGLFLLGVLNRRATVRGALVGMFTGLGLMLYLWKFTPLAWTWYVLVGTVTTFAVGSVASLFDTAPQQPEKP
ncbi:MAG: sodium/solute symporter [Acidobacteria bacterium]|nr:sodium/solute symporter [Acidobacteriota bacterium]MBI3664552.1 sodium/solute symporter [Acidobacteriota bacterium]